MVQYCILKDAIVSFIQTLENNPFLYAGPFANIAHQLWQPNSSFKTGTMQLLSRLGMIWVEKFIDINV